MSRKRLLKQENNRRKQHENYCSNVTERWNRENDNVGFNRLYVRAGAGEKATMSCTCPEAVEYQKEKQRKEKAMKNVSVLFGEDAAPEKRAGEGIVNILRAAVEEIYTGGLAKVTLNLRGGVKASISQNSKGEINVERIETKKQKLTE